MDPKIQQVTAALRYRVLSWTRRIKLVCDFPFQTLAGEKTLQEIGNCFQLLEKLLTLKNKMYKQFSLSPGVFRGNKLDSEGPLSP